MAGIFPCRLLGDCLPTARDCFTCGKHFLQHIPFLLELIRLNHMKKTLQILNLITFIAAVAVNYLYNTGSNAPNTVGEISDKYENLLTPAGYAFSIWGLIYLMLALFAIFQARSLFSSKINDLFLLQIGPWFILSNIVNAGWIVAFTNDLIGLSVLLMLVFFASLLKIVVNLNMDRWHAPKSLIFFIWWPFSVYFGWLNVALIANLSVYFRSLGWDGAPLSQSFWAVLVLAIAGAVFTSMIWSRNMREYAVAGSWGIVAIAVNNWGANPVVAYTALGVAAIVVLNVFIHGFKKQVADNYAS
jgi:hypothetical protein